MQALSNPNSHVVLHLQLLPPEPTSASLCPLTAVSQSEPHPPQHATLKQQRFKTCFHHNFGQLEDDDYQVCMHPPHAHVCLQSGIVYLLTCYAMTLNCAGMSRCSAAAIHWRRAASHWRYATVSGARYSVQSILQLGYASAMIL